ncbi:MAG: homocysteine S-methyltransferase family protein [Oscillospiraceae bacterium]|nr:homocysteine S-methyltransferase family protein [Oscillospiraceae bacterium]
MERNGLPWPLLLDGAPEPVSAHGTTRQEQQRACVAAGSNVLRAPTVGLNRWECGPSVSAEQLARENRARVTLTRGAADGKAAVAGCLGSVTEWHLHREEEFEDLVAAYRAQAEALRDGVDVFFLEHMGDIPCARAALLGIRAVSDKPVWARFVCDESGRIPSGSDCLAALIILQGMGVSAFGIACNASPDRMLEQLTRLAPYAQVPLIAGLYVSDPAEAAACVPQMAAAGVRIFSAPTPEAIRAVRQAALGVDLSAVPPPAVDEEVIACASEREGRFISPTVDVGEVIACSPDLVEDILKAEEESPQGALKISILEQDDLALFVEHQYVVQDALCIWSDVPELLERALRLYQGRAFWDGTGDLSPDFLREMQRKYGLVLL